jgi:hypothetical protein
MPPLIRFLLIKKKKEEEMTEIIATLACPIG